MKEELKKKLDHCINLSVDFWNAWMDISDSFKHQNDNQEMSIDIHHMQNRLFTVAHQNDISLKK